jgi:hypothetical protein
MQVGGEGTERVGLDCERRLWPHVFHGDVMNLSLVGRSEYLLSAAAVSDSSCCRAAILPLPLLPLPVPQTAEVRLSSEDAVALDDLRAAVGGYGEAARAAELWLETSRGGECAWRVVRARAAAAATR